MSYRVWISSSQTKFSMPLKYASEALAALLALGKNGYGESLTKLTSSTDNWEYLPDFVKLQKLLKGGWGLNVEFDEAKQNVVKIDWAWESDYGSQNALTAIAPFVDSGSIIHWKAEDGDQWRIYFKDGKLQRVSPEVVWPV